MVTADRHTCGPYPERYTSPSRAERIARGEGLIQPMNEVDRRVGVVDRRSPQLAGERAEWRRADEMARQSAPVGKDRRKPGVTDRRRQGGGERPPGALTGLSADQLAYYVEEMRKVAARTGHASLEAADILLWAFQQSQEHGATLSE